jgi:hypothetical protein
MSTLALSDADAKAAFARLFVECKDAFKAALLIFGNDTQKALRVSYEWPGDPEVIAETERLTNEGAAELLLSKEQTAFEALQMARDTGLEGKDRIKALELYASIMDYLPKREGTKIQVNNNKVQRSVFVVPHCGTETEWEKALIEQQRRLMNEAAEA